MPKSDNSKPKLSSVELACLNLRRIRAQMELVFCDNLARGDDDGRFDVLSEEQSAAYARLVAAPAADILQLEDKTEELRRIMIDPDGCDEWADRRGINLACSIADDLNRLAAEHRQVASAAS